MTVFLVRLTFAWVNGSLALRSNNISSFLVLGRSGFCVETFAAVFPSLFSFF